jgi:hypothetical protein
LLDASCSRKTRNNIDLSNTSFLHCAIPLHFASLHERLENLRLIESSDDWPDLAIHHSQEIASFNIHEITGNLQDIKEMLLIHGWFWQLKFCLGGKSDTSKDSSRNYDLCRGRLAQLT